MNELAKKDFKASVARHSRRKPYREARLKPQPLILEQQHRNIGTLMALLTAIIIGLGSGWLAGDVLKEDVSPAVAIEHVQANPEENQDKAIASNASNVVSESEEKPQANNSEVVVARRNDDERDITAEQSSRRTARTSGGRRAVVAGSAGEPLPLAIIKGKPLRKAFRPLKKVKFW